MVIYWHKGGTYHMYFVLGTKEKRLIAVIVIAVLILVLFFIPRSTRVSYSRSGVKVSKSGTIMGIVWINMEGKYMDYLLAPSRLKIHFSEVDPFNLLLVREQGSTRLFGYTSRIKGSDIQYTNYKTFIITDGERTAGRIGFSPDLDRWIIYNDDEGFYYLIGKDPSDSTHELLAYFHALVYAE